MLECYVMSIAYLQEKIKQIGSFIGRKDVYTALIIILVGVGSFGLGRLSGLDKNRSPITLEHMIAEQAAPTASPAGALGSSSPEKVSNENVQEKVTQTPLEGGVVASKNSTKYHFPWCAGAKQIKEENKIWFASAAEAEKAGYTKAGNCK